MNKKIIICIVCCVLLLGLLTGLLIKNKLDSDDSELTVVNIDSSVNKEETNIDWNNYSTSEITTSGEDVNITKDGIYTLTGEINGKVIVNTSGNVKLILDNVTINSSDGPCILVSEADNVVIELKDGTTNTLTDSTNYKNYPDEDGVVFSHDDLIIEGNGTLVINSNYADGIVSKDDLTINSGTYKITSIDDAIRGKDSVYIKDGNFTINTKGDAIKSTNETDEGKGFVLIEGGTFNINSVSDGIQAVTKLIIKDGDFTIKTTGDTDTDTAKGLKADILITIDGGKININSTDDSIHSNGIIVINKGTITINSGDDAIHADGMIEINGGTIVATAHEGLEATYVKINDGDITINATDDGINAGNKSSDYSVKIEINGGNITIKMGQGDTDAIDSNGDIYVNGGTINITGQSPFDYDGTAKYTGGTIIVNGVETNQITNQFMGGGMQGGMQGQMPGGMQGNRQRGRR